MAHLNSGAVAADMIMSSTPAAANSPPVDNSTTIPLNGKGGGYQEEPQQKEAMGGGGGRGEEKYELRTFNNLPERTPVDIQFKDISYCVKAGFRKGELARGLR